MLGIKHILGGLTAHTSYDPYGNRLHHAQQPDTPTTSLGYTGEMTDPSGLVYLRARYYNPATATFLSRDPFPGYAHLALSRNGYSYVDGNPLNGAVGELLTPIPGPSPTPFMAQRQRKGESPSPMLWGGVWGGVS